MHALDPMRALASKGELITLTCQKMFFLRPAKQVQVPRCLQLVCWPRLMHAYVASVDVMASALD